MNAKEYYRTGKHSTWKPSLMRQQLYRTLVHNYPHEDVTVFEFGCGRGENLRILESFGIKCWGIEINPDEVKKAVGGQVQLGDESLIDDFVKDSFAVSFTIGVMDHIPEEDFYNVLNSIEKVTKKCIFMLETNDTPTEYYYPHDYKSSGFDSCGNFQSTDDKCMYTLWSKKVC